MRAKKNCLHWNIVGIEWEKPETHTRRMFAHISLATKYDWIQRQTEMGQKWASGFFMIWTLKCNKFYLNGKTTECLTLWGENNIWWNTIEINNIVDSRW